MTRHHLLAGAAAMLALALAAGGAQAQDCQPGYKKLLADAQARGDTAFVELLRKLPEVPAVDGQGSVVCTIRLRADLLSLGYDNLEESEYSPTVFSRDFRDTFDDSLPRGLSIRPNSPSRDANGPPADIDVLDDNERVVFGQLLQEATFSGVHIGQTLEGALGALLAAGYKSDAIDPKQYPYLFRGVYRFNVDCFAETLASFNSRIEGSHLVNMCGPEVGHFSRVDARGTHYDLDIYFTDTGSSKSMGDALYKGLVYKIDGVIAQKGDFDEDYYKSLATSRYADLLEHYPASHDPRPRDLNREVQPGVTWKYPRNWEGDDDCTCVQLSPGAGGLHVHLMSTDLYGRSRDAVIDRLISETSQTEKAAPRPDF